jgi:hypothetical protein
MHKTSKRSVPFFRAVFCLVVPLGLFSITGIAQKKNEKYQLHIKKTVTPVIINGEADDEAWAEADIAENFFMVLPMDTSHARVRTDVRMAYDDENLYLLAECFHAVPGPYYVESLRRDFTFGKNDNFLLFMDPFDDQTNGFSFGANAAGAQWDGTMYEGGKVDLNWDNKWISAVKNKGDKWVFEASVPFKSIRYKKGITRWGINFSRLDLKTTEKSSWAPVPRQFPTASLAYSGILVWDAPPPTPKVNMSLIPYVLGGINKNYEAGSKPSYRKDIGVDAKISLSSSLNLDLTVNPDFSQVEVDRQITNLDRFELFFPERRQFFLENGDLFSNIGYTSLRPFFSRRIGLGAPIHYGLRLSGKLDKDWRMGVMNVQSGKQENLGLPVQNFTVASLQRKVFSRSNIGMFFINKQSFGDVTAPDSSKPVYNAYNRNVGIEYNHASSNNLWTGKMLFIKSFSPGKQNDDIVNAGHLQYASRKWTVAFQYEYVGRDYQAETGYVPRRDYLKLYPQISKNFFPKSGKILAHGPKLFSTYYMNTRLKQTDYEHVFAYNIAFRNQSVLVPWVAYNYVQLLQPFDPTNMQKDSLAVNTLHSWRSFGADYTSKPQSLLTYTFSTRYGGYYADGTRFNLSTDIGYRWQPYVNVSVSASYNSISLPQPWGNIRFLLVGPRVDLTMSNKLFLTGFMQYNEQTDNINLNLRFQWRYTPASDLFLVYTDNYLPENFKVRNRAVVLKFNYWWNR